LKEACRQKKDELYRKDTLEIHRKLGFKAREVQKKQLTISTLQSELKGLSELKKGLEAQIAALEAKTAPDGERFIQLTQDVQFLKANPQPELAAKEQELLQMKEQFEILAQSRELIGLIRQRLADIPALIENRKAAISQAEQELDPLVLEQAQIQQQIDTYKQEREALEQESQKLDRAYQKAQYEMNENPEIRAFNLDKKKHKAKLQSEYEAVVQRQLEEFKELLGISEK
jgi:chromosome segregation ATPase